MRNHNFALSQIMSGHGYAFIQKPAGILAQIEQEALDVVLAQLLEIVFHLLAGVFVELGNMHVCDSRTNPEGRFDAIARDLVANDVELQRLFSALASHRYLHVRPTTSTQQVSNFRSREVVGALIVNLDQHVAGAKPSFICRRSTEGRDDDGLAVARADRHADAVIVTLLIVTQRLEIFGIEEIRVWIQRSEHARDGAFVDGLVGTHLVGEVVLYRLVYLGELLDAGLEVFFRTIRCGRDTCETRPKDTSQDRAENDNE